MRSLSVLVLLGAALNAATPALAQRGSGERGGPGGPRAEGQRPADGPRDLSGVGNLVAGGLSSARPGVDLFRAGPDTFRPGSGPGPWLQPVGPWLAPITPWIGQTTGRVATPSSQPRHDRDDRGGRGYRGGNGVLYPVIGGVYGYPYGYSVYSTGVTSPQQSAAAEAPVGFLRLVVAPRRTGVFVDGIYEGTVDDFGGTGERALTAGLHRVRLEADGFESVEFDARVPANDTITLRRDLDVRATPPPAVAPPPSPITTPSAPKTLYVIPRCYLGDVAPTQAQLSPGCSIDNLRTLRGN